MRWFRECGCELIVLETGMGGRLDATTAVPADVCVITPIGMDHMQWLGETIEKIAAEKPGFSWRENRRSPRRRSPARGVLEKRANEIRSPLEFMEEPLLGYPLALAGEHQQWNAALAVAALHAAGLPLREEIIRYGLSKLNWPGRFEEIQPGVILDGAHNPHSAAILAQTWRMIFPGKKPTLVFSAVASKDITGILGILAPLAARILFCPVDTPRAVPADELAACEKHNDFAASFVAAKAHEEPILVAGSLFLVGEARACLTGRDFQSSTQ
jgi:dihydrofolate synthase / folylpolyglutamate synthase